MSSLSLESNQSRFLDVVKRGDLSAVKSLICLGDVDVHFDDDRAFRLTCSGGHTETARFLLEWCESRRASATKERQVDAHFDDDDAFRLACRNGHTETARFLLEWCEL